ncbi:MAG TPA: 50S ribosomal protein L29 [Firmicutes bacterium]|jgi:large subunit ribosomal protein L29|nr:50S ribosomal protein L29 [Bacillota bacterium]
MKAKEIRDMTSDELKNNLSSLKEELFNLRFQLATGQLDNSMKVKDVRKSIAKVMTVMRERELGINKA